MAQQSSYDHNGSHVFYTTSIPPISGQMGPPLDFPPRPMEVDLTRMLPQGLGDDFLSSPLSNARVAPLEGFGSPQDSLTSWYSRNDGPWIPPKLVPDTVGNLASPKHRYRHRKAKTSHTGSSVPYGDPFSDSGYETRRSDTDTSVFGIEPDCQSLMSHITGYHMPQVSDLQGIGQVIQQHDIQRDENWASSDVTPLVCRGCRANVKTQSELKKHDLRHRKPFKCTVQACSRTEGFSTSNDLERHIKSKHRLTGSNKPSKSYRCSLDACKTKIKTWPRADNFRNHLRRVHGFAKEDSCDELIRRSEYLEVATNNDQDLDPQLLLPPPREIQDTTFFQGRTSSVAADHIWQSLPLEINELDEDLEPSPVYVEDRVAHITTERSPLPEVPLGENGTVQPVDIFQPPAKLPVFSSILLAPVGKDEKAGQTESQTKASRQTLEADVTEVIKLVLSGSNSLEKKDSPDVALDLPCERASLGEQWSPDSNRSGSPQAPSPSSYVNSPSADSVDSGVTKEVHRKAQELIEAFHKLGYSFQRNGPSTVPLMMQNPGTKPPSKSTCHICNKYTGRPSEMKKHMKRHDRPYGCTFPTCSKTFGSKNDWKRHEDMQHYHVDQWRCDFLLPGSDPSHQCTKVCYRRNKFQDHLTKAHQITSPDQLKEKIERCRMGNNCQGNFWCGFCEKTIALSMTGLDALKERYDHIDHHFMGTHDMRKQSIAEWKHVDVNVEQAERLGAGEGDDGSSSPSSSSTGSGSGSGSPDSDKGNDDSKKRKRSLSEEGVVDEDDERIAKQLRAGMQDTEKVVYCCQCEVQYNPDIQQKCTNCADEHQFCDGCPTREAVFP